MPGRMTTLDRSGYELEFEDTFDGPALDERRWLPYYLPQWSSRERAAARYRLGDGRLTLLVEPDQPPWCPELDGEVQVSSLQTGLFSGPLGSALGQHRFTLRPSSAKSSRNCASTPRAWASSRCGRRRSTIRAPSWRSG